MDGAEKLLFAILVIFDLWLAGLTYWGRYAVMFAYKDLFKKGRTDDILFALLPVIVIILTVMSIFTWIRFS